MRVLVGSRDLWPTPNIASIILAIMATNTDDYAVRCDSHGNVSSMVEEMALRIGDRIDRKVMKWYCKDIGSSAAFVRDNEMVTSSRGVFAFFSPGALMHGGTGHVVTVALRLGLPVEAYEPNDYGTIELVAADEGELMHAYANQEDSAWSS